MSNKKVMKLKDKGLAIIEGLTSDDLSERFTYNVAMKREAKLREDDLVCLGNKIATIYKISHALRDNAICHESHADWRKQINNLYRQYKRRGII